MNLVTHLLKKDVRRSRIMLAVWLLLVILQCVLIGSGVNSADRVTQALYQLLSVLVPLFQLLVLIVVIPHVVQDEPLVGTTAFWFTRPISRGVLLKSKTLFTLLVLVIPPLVAELVVLAANGATGRDLSLAVPEIVMEQLAFILTVAILAVITPNFGRFAVVGAIVVVAAILLQIAITWTTIYLHPQSFMNQAANYSLGKSQGVVGSLATILVAAIVIAHQYLTRKTSLTVAGAIAGVFLVLAIRNLWTWDFLQPPEPAPSTDTSGNFDTSVVKASLGSNVNASDVMTMRGQGAPDRSITAQINTPGVPKGYVVDVRTLHAHLSLQDGQPVNVTARQSMFFGTNQSGDALELPLEGIPVVNANNYQNNMNTALFTLDAITYDKYSAQQLKFSADVDFTASRYRITAEMPLVKGSRYDKGSEHAIITDVLKQPDGVDIVLRERRLHLLFDRTDQVNPYRPQSDSNAVYLLVNKKRREAVIQKQTGSFNVNFQVGFSRLVNNPVRLSFGPEQNGRSQLMPDLTPEWLADATLDRLELVPVASFSRQVTSDKFVLNGEIHSSANTFHSVKPDAGELGKIVLPENATKDQVKEYVNSILIASRRQNTFTSHDPQFAMLEKVGPENLDVLLGVQERLQNGGQGRDYIDTTIGRLVRPEDKPLILNSLATDRDLAKLVIKFGWAADARDTLIAGLGQERKNLPSDWIKAIASLQDPSTYPALKAYLVDGYNKQETLDALKTLPGIDLTDSVDAMWKKAKYGDPIEVLIGADIAAQYGHLDALDTAAGILKKEKNTYLLTQASRIIKKFTPATGDNAALIVWYQANRDKLTFDPQTKKFLPQK